MSDLERRLTHLERPFVKNNDGAFGRAVEEHGTAYLNSEGRKRGIFDENRPDDQPLTESEWEAVAQAQQAELLSRPPLSDWSGEYDG